MGDDEDSRTIWCKNLSERVTNDILYELFYQAGPVDKVRIPRDNEGRQRNFGFITYTHKESVSYAIKLFEGTSLFDRKLKLQKQRRSDNIIVGDFNLSPDVAMLLGRPLLPEATDADTELELKFIEMKNSSIINGSPALESQYPGPSMIFGNYDQNQGSNRLGNASLQGQWSSRNNLGRDRINRRFEPYRGDHGRRNDNDLGKDRGRSDRNGTYRKERDYEDRNDRGSDRNMDNTRGERDFRIEIHNNERIVERLRGEREDREPRSGSRYRGGNFHNNGNYNNNHRNRSRE